MLLRSSSLLSNYLLLLVGGASGGVFVLSSMRLSAAWHELRALSAKKSKSTRELVSALRNRIEEVKRHDLYPDGFKVELFSQGKSHEKVVLTKTDWRETVIVQFFTDAYKKGKSQLLSLELEVKKNGFHTLSAKMDLVQQQQLQQKEGKNTEEEYGFRVRSFSTSKLLTQHDDYDPNLNERLAAYLREHYIKPELCNSIHHLVTHPNPTYRNQLEKLTQLEDFIESKRPWLDLLQWLKSNKREGEK